MPREWLGRVQVVEYLRAFLLGRTGWSRLGGLLVISGAFGVFRRDLVVELGGLDDKCIGEDAELVVRLHRHLRRQRRDYRIVFVAEPVSWSETPVSLPVLARQRRRWHRGLTEILWKHRGMVGNPRYGRIGLVALPYYLVFELLAPVVELAGLVLSARPRRRRGGPRLRLAVRAGRVRLRAAAHAGGAGRQEYSFHRYHRWQDLGAAVTASVVENLGYRQATAWWRLRGLLDALLRRRAQWGQMTRVGFAASGPVADDVVGPVPASGPVLGPSEVVGDAR